MTLEGVIIEELLGVMSHKMPGHIISYHFIKVIRYCTILSDIPIGITRGYSCIGVVLFCPVPVPVRDMCHILYTSINIYSGVEVIYGHYITISLA